uniref:Major facilitator superfamily (MFS) profile domain-containing protein n=1 Tax=Peronospora matthiolae TaxID=2874970 RepID=A0AAV1TA43_9STRA
MFYASSFFQNADWKTLLIASITLVYIVNVTIAALMLMDSAGRRPLLIWSMVGMLCRQ